MTAIYVSPHHVSKPEFRSDIQGLRAIAVLGVILFHANRDWLPGGFVGVDVFFVISGFLIAGMIQQKKMIGQFSFVDFYLARARRIAPAYFSMLAVVTFFAAILFIPKDFEIYWQSAKSAIYFGSNAYFSSFGDYFGPSAHELPLLHTWSLAIEMQFYLILPALLIFLPEKFLKPIISILILALFIFGIVLVADGDKKGAYFSLFARMPEFLVGTLLALFVQRDASGKLFAPHIFFKDVLAAFGLLLIFSSFIFINESLNFPGVLIAFPCVGAALIIAGHGGRITSVLSSAPLTWVGGISYSLYLLHWPAFAFARYVTGAYTITPSLLAGLLITIFALAYVSLRWIETPFRNKNWLVGTGLVRTILLSFCILAPISSAKWVNAAVEDPLPIEYTRYADQSTICHGNTAGSCLRGGSKLSHESPVLVIGDSHAAQLNLFFDRVGEKTGKKYRVISASSCVTIPGFDVERIPDYAQNDCKNSVDFAKKFIADSDEVVLAAMWQYQLKSPKFILALKDFLLETKLADKKVTVLWQVPMLASNVQRLRRFDILGLHGEIKVNEEWQSANQRISEIVAEYPNVRFVELSEDEIFSNLPFYKGRLLYSDESHLNEVGSILYAEVAAIWFEK